MSFKTVVITGASRGIGLSFAKLYQAKGCHVYAACRSASAELTALGVNVIEHIDVTKDEDIGKLASALNGVPIDLLINNAGILRDERLGSIDKDSIRRQFETNALAPLAVTEALMNNFSDGAKLALITSRMGSVEDNTSGGRYGYRMSKSALNIAGMSLSHDLKPRGVAVAILHPGLVGTEMIGGYGDITPDQAAERLAQRIEALNLENTGTFWHSNGQVLPW
ncbi:MAG: short-chain dehydrogenase [Marinomonas sp.]|jgi:NAD(P)-dependent dehydrogenase (short-subunit alcohol dehydrogenase family)|uniref:SDR family oxidoreductase n=1 Tax=Marinomonas communis TaxID=28254 RepID=UPI0010045CED|nr:SDR family oxidoreductase [Marinomonas communis]MCC4273186.1 SDR family oxidoreductase [Marinomonas communis]RUM50055.1 MAG: short-chain dehydrogenase [Marinomonas sp.]|tara:strand:+ start:256 stop:924 length:669 start_codon:yes stop_codon:yes gene_type:complete